MSAKPLSKIKFQGGWGRRGRQSSIMALGRVASGVDEGRIWSLYHEHTLNVVASSLRKLVS